MWRQKDIQDLRRTRVQATRQVTQHDREHHHMSLENNRYHERKEYHLKARYHRNMKYHPDKEYHHKVKYHHHHDLTGHANLFYGTNTLEEN